jgi:hypothetical protein
MPKMRKTLSYVTVLAKGLTSFQQPIQKVKIVAICMECFQKKKWSTSQTGLKGRIEECSIAVALFSSFYCRDIQSRDQMLVG